MMVIRGLGPTAAAAAPPRRTGGARFALPSSLSTEAPRELAASAEVAMSGMLALQEMPPPVDDRQARRHGQDLIEELAALHRAVLGAGGHTAALDRLMRLAVTLPTAGDPALRAVLGAIVLRARIELARRGRTT